jgi:5-methylcytosine-specific restriction endonuclease McrA
MRLTPPCPRQMTLCERIIAVPPSYSKDVLPGFKRCTRCELVKPTSDFYLRGDGHYLANCAVCAREVQREAYGRDPERFRKRTRDYYRRNGEEVRAKKRAIEKAFPEKTRAKRRAYEDRTRQKTRTRKALHQRVRKHRLRANGGDLTASEWEKIVARYGGCCLRCGATGNITIDHVVPISAGGANCAANVQPLCGSCNSVKKNFHATDYRLTAFARMKAREVH